MIKPMDEMTAEDYQKLGLKAGLEIHQQLFTTRKLFCRCKAGEYGETYDAEILRHMRPTLSELGEYDGTALMEFKTKKDIIYQLNKETVCTYEMDDAPPFELNRQALDIALEITMLLSCNLVSELHIARKQYLDGSIPTGFQRTTILGVDGAIPYQDRKIGIIQLGLEEDACREVSDIGHTRTYKTDRLGMPLIEIVTYPQMHTPQQVADVAQILRTLTRITGKVRRGIGATRQDVNVSITGSTRIEIKGVPRIPMIPLLVHNEAGRQNALLNIRDELKRRGLTAKNFQADFFDVTDILKNTAYQPIMNSWQQDFKISCVRIHKYKGILRYPTQPDTSFAKEISDRLRVIACLANTPNIIHTDSLDETISSANWTKIRKVSNAEPDDTLVIVWGNTTDVAVAEKEIAIRASEAIVGIPSETRQALPDGTNGFERILPGPDRMYPDTDLPPIPLTENHIAQIQSQLPELPWKRFARYQALGLPEHIIKDLILSHHATLFDQIVHNYPVSPMFVANILVSKFTHWRRKGLNLANLTDETIRMPFKLHAENKLVPEAIPLIFEALLKNNALLEALIEKYRVIDAEELRGIIHFLLEDKSIPAIVDNDKKHRYVMGLVMSLVKGRIAGKTVNEKLKEILLTT